MRHWRLFDVYERRILLELKLIILFLFDEAVRTQWHLFWAVVIVEGLFVVGESYIGLLPWWADGLGLGHERAVEVSVVYDPGWHSLQFSFYLLILHGLLVDELVLDGWVVVEYLNLEEVLFLFVLDQVVLHGNWQLLFGLWQVRTQRLYHDALLVQHLGYLTLEILLQLGHWRLVE